MHIPALLTTSIQCLCLFECTGSVAKLTGIGKGNFVFALATGYAIIGFMNNKHRKTLNLIFTNPVNGNIEWRRIEALFLALGAIRTERAGSLF